MSECPNFPWPGLKSYSIPSPCLKSNPIEDWPFSIFLSNITSSAEPMATSSALFPGTSARISGTLRRDAGEVEMSCHLHTTFLTKVASHSHFIMHLELGGWVEFLAGKHFQPVQKGFKPSPHTSNALPFGALTQPSGL